MYMKYNWLQHISHKFQSLYLYCIIAHININKSAIKIFAKGGIINRKSLEFARVDRQTKYMVVFCMHQCVYIRIALDCIDLDYEKSGDKVDKFY